MNFCDSQADTRLEETLPCNAEHVGLYILALQHFLGHWKSLHTWECLPVTGLQISAPAVVTNPELEELGGGGSSTLGKGRRASPMGNTCCLHRETQAFSPARVQGPCLLPNHDPRRFHTHTQRLSTSRSDWQQSVSPISPLVFGGLMPAGWGRLQSQTPLAALPHGRQALCKRWGAAVFSTELIAAVFCVDPNPYQKALVVTAWCPEAPLLAPSEQAWTRTRKNL